jgi:hypothetical protein
LLQVFYTQNPSTQIFFPIINSSLKTKYYVSPYKLSTLGFGKEGKKKLKENQWWVGKWVGWVRA